MDNMDEMDRAHQPTGLQFLLWDRRPRLSQPDVFPQSHGFLRRTFFPLHPLPKKDPADQASSPDLRGLFFSYAAPKLRGSLRLSTCRRREAWPGLRTLSL